MNILRIVVLFIPDSLFLGFLMTTAPFFLREQGGGAGAATAVAYLGLPLALAFLWAPFVDRHPLPGLDRRSGWAGACQLAAALALLLAGGLLLVVPNGGGLALILPPGLVVAVILATRNLSLNAWMREALDKKTFGVAVGARMAGAAIGNWLGAGLVASQFPLLGWAGAFLVMALALLVTWPAVLGMPPGRAEPVPGESLRLVFRDLFARPGVPAAIGAMTVISALAAPPFTLGLVLLADIGMSAEQIGMSVGYIGSIVGLATAIGAGKLVDRIDPRAALAVAIVLQALLSLGFALLGAATAPAAWLGGTLIILQIGVYAGISAICMVMALRLASLRHASTEVAFIYALLILAGTLVPNLAGFLMDALGDWGWMFTGHALLTPLLGLWAVRVLGRGLRREDG